MPMLFKASCFATTCFKIKEIYLCQFALFFYSLVIMHLRKGAQVMTCFEAYEQGRVLGSTKMGQQDSRLQFQKQEH